MKKYSIEIVIILIIVILFGLLSLAYRIGYRTGYNDGAVKYYRIGYIECADTCNKKLGEIVEALKGVEKLKGEN